MKKLNLICASIAVLCATTAGAGTLTTAGTVFATENFGATFPATGAGSFVRPGAVTYSLSTITAVNAGATVYFTVRLSGAKFAAAPAANTFSFAGQAAGTDIGARTLSADGTTVQVAVTPAASVNIGLGAFSYTPGASDINSVGTTLATAGGKVDVTVGLTTIAAANAAALDSSNALTTVDAPLPTSTLASSASAITGTVSTLPTGGTGVKIDLTATPAGGDFTAGNGGQAILGTVKFADKSGTQNVVAGNADYNLAAANGGFTVTVTPGTGQSFPIGTVLSLHTGLTCGAAVANTTGTGTTADTANTASTAKTLTTTTVVTTGTEYSVCLSDPTGTNTATPITTSIAAQTVPAAATDAAVSASGTGYALDYNGSTVEVTSYWPGALDQYSYKGYLKITNTGSVSAAVTGQHRDDAGALVGTAKVLAIPGKLANGVLAAGQSVLLSTKEIDTLLGANPSGAQQGRIRLTAPTNGLRVQSLLQTGSDAPIEYSTTNGI